MAQGLALSCLIPLTTDARRISWEKNTQRGAPGPSPKLFPPAQYRHKAIKKSDTVLTAAATGFPHVGHHVTFLPAEQRAEGQVSASLSSQGGQGPACTKPFGLAFISHPTVPRCLSDWDNVLVVATSVPDHISPPFFSSFSQQAMDFALLHHTGETTTDFGIPKSKVGPQV